MSLLQRIIVAIVRCALGGALLVGCAQNLPYHAEEPEDGNCRKPSSEQCASSFYQSHENFDLAFVEYSERGNAFDRAKVRKALDRIAKREQETGVVVITYVHGWTHNAEEHDRDVRKFKEILGNLGADSEVLSGRRLVGVYVGWRGASLDLPYLELVTFWDRKAVAEEVGKGAVTEMLLRLDQLDRNNPRNVFVTIGHSFGGAIVLTALSETIVEGIIDSADAGDQGQVRGVGDGVILLNPAIEANQALILVETALSREYPQGQDPLLLALSSDADWATHYAFPAGQTVGLLLTWRQADLAREYYVDRRTNEPVAMREEDLDTATVGNFAPFLTHRLTLKSNVQPTCDDDGARGIPELELSRCEDISGGCVSVGLARTPDYVGLKELPDDYPLYFIKTDAAFMRGHSDIFNPNVISFLTSVIDFRMRKTYGLIPESRRSILQNGMEIDKRFRKFRETALESECRLQARPNGESQ